MGPYLTVPKKEKDSVDSENTKMRFGATGMQGWRNTMEDSHIAELDLGNGISFFGVYDGHGVNELKNLQSFKQGDYEQSLKDIYLRMDEMLKTSYGKSKLQSYKKNNDSSSSLFGRGSDDIANAAGCTACSALITPTDIFIGNAGDSRAVLAKKTGDKYQAIEMSVDHKPELAEEKQRIEKAGGFVEENRVKGILNLSRSLGDLEYKSDSQLALKDQMITAMPEVKKIKYDPSEYPFLVIACDGIWDCLTSQEAIDFVGELMRKKEKLSMIIEEMFDKIVATDVASSGGIGCDNMTCIIIQFKQQ